MRSTFVTDASIILLTVSQSFRNQNFDLLGTLRVINLHNGQKHVPSFQLYMWACLSVLRNYTHKNLKFKTQPLKLLGSLPLALGTPHLHA
jgi:hypothetical protein